MCHRHCIDGHNQDAQHHLRHFRHQVNRHHFLRTYPITASEHKYVKEAEKIKKYRYGGIPGKITPRQQGVKYQGSSPTQYNH